MYMFRLMVTGDYDMEQLEGIDPVLHGSIIGNTFEGNLDDAEVDNVRFHWHLQLFFVCAALMGFFVINVYIGLLSNLYDEGKRYRHQIHQHFKAQYTVRLLIYIHIVGKILGSPCCGRRRLYLRRRERSVPVPEVGVEMTETERQRRQAGTERGGRGARRSLSTRSMDDKDHKGCWIVFDPNYFMDESPDKEVRAELAEIKEQLQDLKEELVSRVEEQMLGDTRRALAEKDAMSEELRELKQMREDELLTEEDWKAEMKKILLRDAKDWKEELKQLKLKWENDFITREEFEQGKERIMSLRRGEVESMGTAPAAQRMASAP